MAKESEQLTSALRDINQSIQQMSKQLSGLSNVSRNMSATLNNGLTGTVDSLRDIQGELKTTRKETINLKAAFSGIVEETKNFVRSMSSSTLGVLGLGGSIAGIITESFQIIQRFSQIGDELRELTSSSVSTGAAINSLYTAWGNSLGSIDQLKGGMIALNNAGLQVGKQFTEMSALMGDLDQITGVTSDQWGQFTGAIAFNFGATTQDIRDISSAMLASGVRGQQLTTAMETVTKAIEAVGYTARDSKEMVKTLARTISAAVGTFQKLGINAQVAGEFLNKMIDPNEFQNNAALFARLGISADDFFASLEGGEGQAKFMEKLMGNLPALADQLASVQNPFQRFNLAKQLGLPMELVSKLAGKTRDEIEELMRVQFEQSKGDQELEKRRAAAKASVQRFEETMEMLKMQALAPIVSLVSKYLPVFMKLLSSLAKIAAQFFTAVSPMIDWLADLLFKAANFFASIVSEAIAAFQTGRIDEFIKNLMVKLLDVIQQAIPYLIELMGQGLKGLFNFAKDNKLAAVIGGALAFKMFSKRDGSSEGSALWVRLSRGGGLSGLINAFTGRGGGAGRGIQAIGRLVPGLGNLTKAAGSLGRVAPMIGRLVPALGGLASGGGGLAAAGGGGAAVAGGGAAAAGSAAVAAAPVAIALAAVAGGLYGLSNSASFFGKTLTESEKRRYDELMANSENLTDVQKQELAALNLKREVTGDEKDQLAELNRLKKLGIQLTADEEKQIADINARMAAQKTTIAQDVSSVTAGALTLGILPIIDTFFGTDLTGAFANWLHPIIDLFTPLFDKINALWQTVKKFIVEGFYFALVQLKFFYYRHVQPAFENLQKFFMGIIKIFQGIFSFDWKLIWEGIKDVFINIGSAIARTFQAVAEKAKFFIGGIIDSLLLLIAEKGGKLAEIFGIDKNEVIARQGARTRVTAAVNLIEAAEANPQMAAGYIRSVTDHLEAGVGAGVISRQTKESYLNILKGLAAQSKREAEQAARQRQNEEKLNAAVGGINANVQEINDRGRRERRPANITANMLNPFAVTQFRFF